jgi:hypothetical protein
MLIKHSSYKQRKEVSISNVHREWSGKLIPNPIHEKLVYPDYSNTPGSCLLTSTSSSYLLPPGFYGNYGLFIP